MKSDINSSQIGIPVIITSAINVSATHTILTDVDTRLQLTLRAIEQWRSTPFISHVVVCDGSGFDLHPYIKKSNLDNTLTECEIISFTNNISKVRTKGKGYGEGEIVNYALKKSRVLKNAKEFAKCTGKLWVENFSDCLREFNGLAAFDFHGNFKPESIDSRFYIVNKIFFEVNMSELHTRVDDRNKFYLEHAFRDGLRNFKLSDYVMYPTPRIRGVSGSMGISYKQPIFKSKLRDIRSLMIKIGRLI